MKSEKAKEYMASLSCEVFPKRVGRPEAIEVCEIAEQEAEERMLDKRAKRDHLPYALKQTRFWHQRDGYMITSAVGCITCFRNYMGVAMPPGFSDLVTTPDQENFIPMLSTGIKDKNGKMTFEGDIVSFNAAQYTDGEIQGQLLCEIIYDNELGGFCLLPVEATGAPYPMWQIGASICVLGNKFEGYDTDNLENSLDRIIRNNEKRDVR